MPTKHWMHAIPIIDEELHPIVGQGQPIADSLAKRGRQRATEPASLNDCIHRQQICRLRDASIMQSLNIIAC